MENQIKNQVLNQHEEDDRLWLENVYQGDVKQLTLRAIIMGAIIGGFMSLTNLYIGLKTDGDTDEKTDDKYGKAPIPFRNRNS